MVAKPPPYQAALHQAKDLAQRKVDNSNSRRAIDLLSNKVIAQQDYDYNTTAFQKHAADAQALAWYNYSEIR
jgi:hypothetical protein